jgi:hypothetical protein
MNTQRSVEYGHEASFWVEYPSGLVDMTRSKHLQVGGDSLVEPNRRSKDMDIKAHGQNTVRIDTDKTAIVIVDMQK